MLLHLLRLTLHEKIRRHIQYRENSLLLRAKRSSCRWKTSKLGTTEPPDLLETYGYSVSSSSVVVPSPCHSYCVFASPRCLHFFSLFSYGVWAAKLFLTQSLPYRTSTKYTTWSSRYSYTQNIYPPEQVLSTKVFSVYHPHFDYIEQTMATVNVQMTPPLGFGQRSNLTTMGHIQADGTFPSLKRKLGPFMGLTFPRSRWKRSRRIPKASMARLFRIISPTRQEFQGAIQAN